MTQSATGQQRKPLLDEASFQKLLQAAHVLQEHNDRLRGRDNQESFAQNLAEIVETQKLIQTLQMDLPAAAELVAARAQKIADASGAAVGILEKGQLCYRAAIGSAAADARQCIAPEEALSAACLSRRSVLHYADAGKDAGERAQLFSERDIKSFIAVPVYHAGHVAGVLELRSTRGGAFREAHVRTAELMGGLLSDAMVTAAGVVWKEALASERQSMLQALERIKPHLESLGAESSLPEPAASAELPAGTAPVTAPVETVMASASPASASPASADQRPQPPSQTESPAPASMVKCLVCGSDFFDESESFCGICGSARREAPISRRLRRPAAAPLLVPYEQEDSANGNSPEHEARSDGAAIAASAAPESLQELLELCANQNDSSTLETSLGREPAPESLTARRERGSEASGARVERTDSIVLQEPLAGLKNSSQRPAAPGGLAADASSEPQKEALLRIFPADLAPRDERPQSPWGSARKAHEWLEAVRTQGKPGRQWLASQWQRRRANIYVAIAAAILLAVTFGWGSWQAPVTSASSSAASSDPHLTAWEKLLVSLGLAEAPPAPLYTGNPDTLVWVDVHTALYHCPGSELYGKTPDGRFAKQVEAQQDQFEPANRKACP